MATDPRDLHAKPPSQAQAFPGDSSRMRPVPDRSSGRLAGKVALITGGDSGIGRRRLCPRGGRRRDLLPPGRGHRRRGDRALRARGRPRGAAAAGRHLGGGAQPLAGRAHGRLDVLVNNAAYQKTQESLHEIDEAEWDRHFAVNISAMFTIAKAAVPHLKPGRAIVTPRR